MSRGYFRERGREDVLSENEAEVASTACLDFLKTGRAGGWGREASE